MGKSGKYSKIAGRHGREGFRQWREDQKNSKRRSIEAGMKWVLVPISEPKASDPEAGDDLTTNEGASLTFKSDVARLRPHPAECWGYRIVRYLTAKDALVGMKPKRRGAGRPRKRDVAGRALVIGEPAVDAGASAMVRPPDGDTTIDEKLLSEDGDPFVVILDQAAAILGSYDYLDIKTETRKVKEDEETRVARQKLNRGRAPEDRIQRQTEQIDVTYVRERLPESKGAITNLQRRTVDVSPGLSRSVQRMLEAGREEDVRKILDDLVVPLFEEFERVFPGAKVVAGGWHVRSGQLHLDMWVHGTWLEIAEVGVNRETRAVRLWDPDILHHFGPGPGVCAWDRHVSALGDEAETYCPGIVAEVSRALADKEQRAAERDPERRGAGQANRDVAIHRSFDRVVSEALPEKFVEIGMGEYREHLKAFYRNAGDRKVTPELLETAELSISARYEAAECDRLAAADDKEKAAKERKAAQAAREKVDKELVAAEASKNEASRILRQAAETKAEVVVREREVAKREAVAQTAVSVSRKGLASKVRTLRSNLRMASSRRALVLKSREAALSVTRIRLAGKIRTMRTKIRTGIDAQVDKALSSLAALVIGIGRAAVLLKMKLDPREAIQKEVAGLRLAETTLSEIAGTVNPGDPNSDTAKLLARARTVVQRNIAARNSVPLPKKQADGELEK